MSIGILYIAIGKYFNFFRDFYQTCESLFINDVKKEYYVFTDQTNEPFLLNKSNIHIYKQEDLGWPGNTLFRFKMFLSIEEQLKKHEYIFFFNGNALFKERISAQEIIPNADESYLVGLSWTNVYTDKKSYPYERNEQSTAYIAYGEGEYYYQGGLNGGRTLEYLELMHSCYNNIEKDLYQNFIACSHDESHINKYLLNRKIKVLNPSYGCPEERDFATNPKIIFRDKNKHLGEKFINEMKGRKSNNIIKRIILKIKNYILKTINVDVIYLQGGLGNQMFQYAFYLSRKIKGINAKYDTTLIKLQNQHNGYELERIFNIKKKESTIKKVFYIILNSINNHKQTNKFYKFLNKCISFIGIKIIYDTEPSIYFDEFQTKRINLFIGYWQTDKYFTNIAPLLKDKFSFNENLLSQKTKDILTDIFQHNSISIHVRRGDYLLNNSFYGNICTINYYNKAIEYIKQHVNEPYFYVFSDDIMWVKEYLNIPNATYINHNKKNDSWQDMYLMSKCKHNIIANSSFSWWGAYLNINPSKIIVSPSIFVNCKSKQDIISDYFVKIEI